MVKKGDKKVASAPGEAADEVGHKHVIKCRCVLPQFKNREDPPPFSFIVFSIVNSDNVVTPRFAQCPHCGVIHKVTGICESEIVQGKESMTTLITIDDVKLSLPDKLVNVLEANGADLPTWEMAKFIYEKKRWSEFVVLRVEEESGLAQGKILRILGEKMFKVDQFTRNEVIK